MQTGKVQIRMAHMCRMRGTDLIEAQIMDSDVRAGLTQREVVIDDRHQVSG